MFYKTAAYNETAIIFWATNEADVDRYIDWLNRDRDSNFVHAKPLGEEGYEDACDFSMDEPHWDDFMGDAE